MKKENILITLWRTVAAILPIVISICFGACTHDDDTGNQTNLMGRATVGAALAPLPAQARYSPLAGGEMTGYGNQAVAVYSDPSVASRHLPFAGEELPGYGNQTTAIYSDNPTGHNSPIPPLQGGGASLLAEGAGEYGEAGRGAMNTPLSSNNPTGHNSPPAKGEYPVGGRGSSTRATPSTPYKPGTQFLPGDRITLSHHHGIMPVTTEMKLDDHGTWRTTAPAAEEQIAINIIGNTTITAQHRHGGIDGQDNIVPDDGTPEAITTYADLLTATATPKPATGSSDGTYHIDLRFQHARALLYIYKVYDEAGNPYGKLAPGTDITLRITDAANTPRRLTAKVVTGGDGTPGAYFVVPPAATIAQIDFLATLDADGPNATPRPYTAYPTNPGNIAFEAGKQYAPQLIVNPPMATFAIDATSDIAPWSITPEEHSARNYTHFIANADDLKKLADEVNSTNTTNEQRAAIRALQTAPITLTDAWTPIGNDFARRFTGLYNGDGHTITGLHYSGSDQFAGLFGYLNPGARITGVHLRDADIRTTRTDGYAGALAGVVNDARIALCSSTGQVSAPFAAGGLVGTATGGTCITRSSSYCTVQATNTTDYAYAGGLVGYNNGSTLLACRAGGTVTGGEHITYSRTGGLVGYNYAATIALCYATGTVTSPVSGRYTGGLVGYNSGSSKISHSYTGAGKLVGENVYGGATDYPTCWPPQDNTTPRPNEDEIQDLVTGDAATFPNIETWVSNDDEFQPRTFHAADVWTNASPYSRTYPGIDYTYTGQPGNNP